MLKINGFVFFYVLFESLKVSCTWFNLYLIDDMMTF